MTSAAGFFCLHTATVAGISLCWVMAVDKRLEQALRILPPAVGSSALQLAEHAKLLIEEVRLRSGKPVSVFSGGREWRLTQNGTTLPVSQKTVEDVVAKAAEYSLYASQKQLSQGFITVAGGHRLGICGEAVCDREGITTLKNFSSVNLRIAHEIRGCADPITDLIWSEPGSVLIIGAPGSGKTTVLRDAVRQLSDRLHYGVGLADERSEIASCVEGLPQYELGSMTDVLSGAPKRDAIPMLLRTMRPLWIAVDEITQPEDVTALTEGAYCGVRFLATAHAGCADDLQNRPVYRALLSQGVFRHLVRIDEKRNLVCERI